MSYDSFYPEVEQIYRIYAVEKQSGKVKDLVPIILEKKLKAQFSTIEASTVFYSEINNCSAEGMPNIRLHTLNTDSTFFRVFPQVFVSGDALQPLQLLNNIVLTESVAIRLFGNVEKAIGQQIQSTFYFMEPPYTVTAVVKDPPPNTNLLFDALLFPGMLIGIANDPEEAQWLQFITQTYVKLHPLTEVNILTEQLRDFTSRSDANPNIEVRMLPVRDIRHRLNTDVPFTLNFIRLSVASGILLMFSALFNFLNLYLDLFRQRIRELRQRAVHGANNKQLILQMMFELTCAISLALFLACFLVILIRPMFSELLGIAIEISWLIQLFVVCGISVVALMLFISLIPFWRLSRLAIRRLPERKVTGRQSVLQHTAVTMQLAVSVVFIIATLVIIMQIRFVNHKHLGFDHSGIIQLSGLPPYMRTNIRTALIHELEAIPQIENITTSNFTPQLNATSNSDPQLNNKAVEMVTKVEWPGKSYNEKPAFQIIGTDSRFAETFGLNMLMGEWYNESGAPKIVLNEEAVRVMGLDEPIGAIIRVPLYANFDDEIEEYEVVGVVNDFHTLSLRSRIHPTIFRHSLIVSDRIAIDNILHVKTIPGNEQEVIRRINAILPGIDPSFAALQLTTLDELYDSFNRSEQAGLKLFSVLATVCLLISLIGIFAVAVAATQRRRKEIAIRKVFGAEVWDIVRIFFREYTMQVIIAGIVALPLAYYAMHQWLQGYAYRTNIPLWLLTGVIVAIAVVVLLTVLGQIWKAANENPAEVVKN